MAEQALKLLGVRMRPSCVKRLDELCVVNDCKRRQILERLVNYEWHKLQEDKTRRIAP